MNVYDKVILTADVIIDGKLFRKGLEGVIIFIDVEYNLAKVYFKSRGIMSVECSMIELYSKLEDSLPNFLIDATSN